jgi:plasmid stabilization system protein ParE
VTWYEGQRFGLGLVCKDAVDAALALVAEHPGLFRRVRGLIRRTVVKRFPYTVHFLEEPDRIVVLAVFHAARDPAELKRRAP